MVCCLQEMVREFGQLWGDLAGFGSDQISTMNAGGYYNMPAANHPKLRILTINTNYL